MARQSRLLVCAALVLLCCAVLYQSSDVLARVPANPNMRRKLEGAIARGVSQLIQMLLSFLPTFCIAGAISVYYTNRDGLTTKTKGIIGALVLLAVGLYFTNQSLYAPSQAEQTLQQPMDRGAPVSDPHSGEEVLMSDGNFVRMADPTMDEGSELSENWRQNLATTLVSAIAKGEEQVVIMFTRQGCPWCDRQLPVFQEAIRRRSAVAGAEGAAAATAFVGGAGAGSLLNAPLRVFVLDAEEFPQLVQGFRVEGFPTSIIFGRPRVTPLIGRGFMELEPFEEALKQAALAEPEPEESEGGSKKKGGKGFLGLR